jgi:regulatory protein
MIGPLDSALRFSRALRSAQGGAAVSSHPIEAELIERWALSYLGHYASSADNLRRVLLRRVRRRVPGDRNALAAAAVLIEALIARYRATGLVDDAAYAAGRAQSLHRRGGSLSAIRAGLARKGIAAADAAVAVAGLREAAPDPDLAAACIYARRHRLGPYRRGAGNRERELGSFARAGFARQIAEAVLNCVDTAAVEALARDGLS